jgi:hypothetical protein
MHVDDAVAFIIEFLRAPRRDDGYPTYGYEIYLPKVIVAYLIEIERSAEQISTLYNGRGAGELSPAFYEAAWELCRRGVLRPGIRTLGAQATPDGASGNGYCLTALGRRWIEQGAPAVFLADSDRSPKCLTGSPAARPWLFAASERSCAIPRVRRLYRMLRHVWGRC